ncbi:male sterility protein domain-containing protein [Phthorimaea operculella]|nr:male sterility protein domain-containing protein [Phthorimaea operculella]
MYRVSYQVSAVVLDEVVGKLLRLGYHQRKKVLQETGLVAVDTTGGYVVFGPVWRPQDLPEGDPVLYGSVLSEVLQRFWESEEPPTADRRKPEDDECELFYQYNTARCPSGRFVFDAVKKLKPGFEKRICPVNANVMERRLGISDEDLSSIITETDIIIHGAATINFNDPLRVAVNTNVRGTMEMLNIGKQCPKLKAFVHISTAFAHATVDRIEKEVAETFYEPPMNPQLALDLVNSMDEQRITEMTPILTKGWVNSYVFTKAIAEEACREAAVDLPISIVRPAIVIASNLEPTPGWLDMSCIFGPSGFPIGVGVGVMHTFQCAQEKNIDLVPVDLVNNAIIATAWRTAKRRSEGYFAPNIYTVTSWRNGIQWRRVIDIMHDVGTTWPTPKAVYYIFDTITNNNLVHFVLSWLWHFIPAYIADVILRIMGKTPMVVKLCNKMATLTKVLSFFTMNTWIMKDDNLQKMYSSLNETDKLIFSCDISRIKWEDFLFAWGLGCRKYILKDGLQGSEAAAKKQSKLRLLHYFVVCPIYFYCLYKVAALVFMLAYYVISTVLSIFF